MIIMQDIIKRMNEEKVRFERALEEMGFERVNFIRLSTNSDNYQDNGNNGNKNDKINGFTTNNGYDSEWYTQTFIRDPDEYSNKPKICLELKVRDGIGSTMTIYPIPWLPHYSLNVSHAINRKEVLRLVREYFSKLNYP